MRRTIRAEERTHSVALGREMLEKEVRRARVKKPDDEALTRALVRFVVRARSGTRITVTANHDRSGRSSVEYDLA